MPSLTRAGQAGTVESNDILVTVTPALPGAGLIIELTSPVLKQYGSQIKKAIEAVLAEFAVTDALIHANDRGALDCTIRARVETAIRRACAGGDAP